MIGTDIKESVTAQPDGKVRWRRLVIFNRTAAPVDITLSRTKRTDAAVPSEQIGQKVVESASTFTWGLRLSETIDAHIVSEERSVGSVPLDLAACETVYIIVDHRGATRILPEERTGPGTPNGINRVQVGCGPHNIFPDWWNVDIRKFRGIDEAVDVTNEWPYKNLDYVYGEQFIEHINLDAGLKFICSAGRSLRSGGILRLTTPNLEWVLKTHYAQTEKAEDIIQGTLNINRAFHGWGHEFLYSPLFLETLCRKAGYADVRFFLYGESKVLDLANLERHGGFRLRDGMANHIVLEAEVGDPNAMTEEWRPFLHRQFLRYYFGGH